MMILSGNLRLYLFAPFLCALTCPLWAQDWPRFRGPNGTGVNETGPLPASPGEANRIWKTDLPPGHSSPSVFRGRLYVTAVDGDSLLTIAVRASDGRELWRRTAPRPRREPLDKRNSAASPTPAAGPDGVFVFFPDFGLIAYSHQGRVLWRVPLGPFDNLYGMGASPVLTRTSVVLVCDQSRKSFIASFDRQTGRERWRTLRPEAISGHSTPAVWNSGRTEQIIAPGSFRLDAYSAATGKSVWHVNGLPSEMKSAPVLNGGTVFISGYNLPENDPGKQIRLPEFPALLAAQDANRDGRLQREEAPDTRTRSGFPFLDLDRNGWLDEAEWRMYASALAAENGLLAIRAGGRGDVTATHVRWKYHRSIPQLPSALLYRGVLYMVNDSGILTTLDPETGSVLKVARVGNVTSPHFASPVAGDGKVYFINRDCGITAISASQQEAAGTAQLEGECYATPAIAAGRLFIRTTNALYAFGVRAGGR
jgi:outer membrane protein assembly factor BamB